MSDPSVQETLPSPLLSSAPPAPRLSRAVTIGCGVVVALLIALLAFARAPSPLERLDHPAEALDLLVGRQLDFREALGRTFALEQIVSALFGAFDDDLDDPITWYEELGRSEGAPPEADLHRVVLIAEAGRGADARNAAAGWERAGGDHARYAAWIDAAYGDAPPDPEDVRAALAAVRRELPRDWFSDTLAARLAAHVGDSAARGEAEGAILERGRALLQRWRTLAALDTALVLAGLAALLRVLGRARRPAIGEAPVPPGWPSADGYGLFVRGAFGFLALAWVPAALASGHIGVITASGYAAGLPLLLWTARYLHRRGESMTAAFGLRARSTTRVIAVAVALTALGLAGETAVSLLGSALDLHTHWADGLPEELLWDPWWLVALNSLDTVLLTPFVEELAFRGLVYGTLRRHLPVAPAALVSALAFAGAHGYGITGFASVLWSGLIWAVAYERTRSLWPSVLAHGANNLMVNVTYLLLLRP